MRKIKTGVIGVGNRGQGLLDTILSIKEAEVVAVSDIYEERVMSASKKVKDKSGIKPVEYLDYHDLLNDKNVEAVLVTANWEEHIHMCIESMRAGKITAMEVGHFTVLRLSMNHIILYSMQLERYTGRLNTLRPMRL